MELFIDMNFGKIGVLTDTDFGKMEVFIEIQFGCNIV